MRQHCRLAMFHQNQRFHQAIQEHQRRARDAVSQAVFESSARCETALSMKLRSYAAQQWIGYGHGGSEKCFSNMEAKLKQH